MDFEKFFMWCSQNNVSLDFKNDYPNTSGKEKIITVEKSGHESWCYMYREQDEDRLSEMFEKIVLRYSEKT